MGFWSFILFRPKVSIVHRCEHFHLTFMSFYKAYLEATLYSYNIAAGTSRPTWKSKRAFVTRTTSVGRREGKCCSGLFLDVGDSLLRVSDGISLDFFIGCVYTNK